MTIRFNGTPPLVMVLAGCLLAGCVAQPVREAIPVPATVARDRHAAHLAALSGHPRWSLQGRVALSNGHDGGSGRLDWQQDGDHFEVSLSAPITRQSWRLSGDAHTAQLDGMAGGPRSGSSAETLLRETTGWVIPVQALAAWVRGMADPDLPAATLVYGTDGHLSRLQQSGWTIDYTRWQATAELDTDMPARLDASRDAARVRLVIDQWQVAADQP